MYGFVSNPVDALCRKLEPLRGIERENEKQDMDADKRRAGKLNNVDVMQENSLRSLFFTEFKGMA